MQKIKKATFLKHSKFQVFQGYICCHLIRNMYKHVHAPHLPFQACCRKCCKSLTHGGASTIPKSVLLLQMTTGSSYSSVLQYETEGCWCLHPQLWFYSLRAHDDDRKLTNHHARGEKNGGGGQGGREGGN